MIPITDITGGTLVIFFPSSSEHVWLCAVPPWYRADGGVVCLPDVEEGNTQYCDSVPSCHGPRW